MNLRKYKLLANLTAMAVGGSMLAPGFVAAQDNADSGAEVQTRGPVHEAFAGTVSFNPEVGTIVDQAPPALIEEVPPEQRLEGDNVSWIPGYWGWDEDQSDFIWISGIWRNLPPGREWVPGYWAELEGRYQWTSGYWEDSEATEVTYLPKPPKSLEVGANIKATSNDQTWVPGNWVYRDDRYAWRTGYWAPARENWAWTPAYYRWSQRGYVYVDGYWDYPVVRRGVVFAPVRFAPEYRARPNYYYTPSTVVSLSVFTNHLFLRPNYGHYYYGDYYEPRYRDRGFYASYSYNSGRYGYDPIYSHNRWENRNDRNWENGRRDYYEYRRDNQDARPPRSWAMMNARAKGDRNRDYDVTERFDRVVNNREDGRQRFQKVDKNERDRYDNERKEIRKYGKDRQQIETRGDKLAANGEKEGGSVSKEKVSRSPVMAKKSDRSDKDGGPPERLQPRASDKDQKTEKSDKDGQPQKSDRDASSDPKGKKDGSSVADSDSKMNDDAERRTKPGEKRQPDATSASKEKSGEKNRQADPTSGNKEKSGGKREGDPNPERVKPAEKTQADPNTERKTKPGEKGQADPTPESQANPKPKRQADPTADRNSNDGDKRQATPSPERQANPNPKRQADPTQERKANPAPNRQANPSPERQANPAPKRKADSPAEGSPSPKPQAEPQSKRKEKSSDGNRESASAPSPKAARQAAAQRSEPKQAKRSEPQTKTKTATAENDTASSDQKKKKKQAE